MHKTLKAMSSDLVGSLRGITMTIKSSDNYLPTKTCMRPSATCLALCNTQLAKLRFDKILLVDFTAEVKVFSLFQVTIINNSDWRYLISD